MTIGEEFRQDAKDIIYDFAVENGLTTYTHKTGQTYDTSTGVKSDVTSVQQYYVAFDEIRDGVNGDGQALSGEYLRNHMLAMVAGVDLLDEIRVGDLVTIDGEQHKVVYWHTDMYEALYTLHIARKPE